MGCHVLLQGIVPTRGSNPHLITSPAPAGGSLPLAPPGEPPVKLGLVIGRNYWGFFLAVIVVNSND